MPEVREDPTTGVRTVISGDRGHRPVRLVPPELAPVSHADCPFCPGNEAVTRPTLASDEQGGRWLARAFPNRFPALRVEATADPSEEGLLRGWDGLGCHEVIAETPDHDARLWEHPEAQRRALRLAQRRLSDLRGDARLAHLGWFRNHGALAGASQPHPHAQIVGSAVVPWFVDQMVARATAWHARTGRPLLADLLAQELRAATRVLWHDANVVALLAWAPRFSFETWIVPRRAAPRFDDVPASEVDSAADALSATLAAMHDALSLGAYNAVLHQAPTGGERGFVWHLRVCPRRVAPGGWEVMTGGTILPVAPEEAAEVLRGALRGTRWSAPP
jgi:UDPglucose--hexose-1-phosphate uridylyltransferase